VVCEDDLLVALLLSMVVRKIRGSWEEWMEEQMAQVLANPMHSS
jgi:hypothetical protein